jgi:hypothetical protein
LAVEVDGKPVGMVNQKGPIENQMEKTFRVGEMGRHTLVLRGTRDTGVITVDAVRILGD